MNRLTSVFIKNWQKNQLAPFYLIKGDLDEPNVKDFVLEILSQMVKNEKNYPTEVLVKKIINNEILDILYLDNELDNKINAVEAIFEFSKLKNFELKYKFIVVNNAHQLNLTSNNKLLKMLEDPIPYTVFLFMAPTHFKLIQTVESRSVVIKIGSNRDPLKTSSTEQEVIQLVQNYKEKKAGLTATVDELKKIEKSDQVLMKIILQKNIKENNSFSKLDKMLNMCHAFDNSTKYINSVAERLYSLCLYL